MRVRLKNETVNKTQSIYRRVFDRLLSVFVTTIFILDLKKSGIGVGSMEYGFPFAYYYSHCFGGYYSWTGLTGNILTAAILSVVIGLISTHFWLMLSSPEFRAKWHI